MPESIGGEVRPRPDREAAFAERGGQRDLFGGQIDGRHLLPVDADQAAGSHRQLAIGRVDHGGNLGRRHGGIVVPGQHGEAGD